MENLSGLLGFAAPFIKEIILAIILGLWRYITQWTRIARRIFVFGFHKSSNLKVYISGYIAKDHSHKLSMGEGQLRALINIFKLIDDYFPSQKSDRSNIEIANLRDVLPEYPKTEELNTLTNLENGFRETILSQEGNWIVVGGPINNIASRLCFDSIQHSNIGFNLTASPVSITHPTNETAFSNNFNENKHYCWVIFLSEIAAVKRKGLIIAGIDTFGTDAAAIYLRSNWLKCHIQRISLKWKNKHSHIGTAFLLKYKRFGAVVKDPSLVDSYSIPRNTTGIK